MATRKKQYQYWRQGEIPLQEEFMKVHAELNDLELPESYNQVMRVMVTIQHMLLTHSRFMLPGIGVIGMSENPRRGIKVSSTTMWWSPGLLTVLAAAPGWENAPLNGYLTTEHLSKINWIISHIDAEDRKILTPNQFFNASDFGIEGTYESDEKMDFEMMVRRERAAKRQVQRAEALGVCNKPHKDLYIEYLQSLIEEPYVTFEEFNDTI